MVPCTLRRLTVRGQHAEITLPGSHPKARMSPPWLLRIRVTTCFLLWHSTQNGDNHDLPCVCNSSRRSARPVACSPIYSVPGYFCRMQTSKIRPRRASLTLFTRRSCLTIFSYCPPHDRPRTCGFTAYSSPIVAWFGVFLRTTGS